MGNSNRHVVALGGALVFASQLTMACSARGSTLFSTMNPSDDYASTNGYSVDDNSGWAAEFQPSASGLVGSIDVALEGGSTQMGMQIVLAADNAGSPGAALETYSINSVPNAPTLENFTSTVHPALIAGTNYWLEVLGDGSEPGIDSGILLPTEENSSSTLDYIYPAPNVYSSGTYQSPAFDVVAVPEPAWPGIASCAMAAMLLRRRRPFAV